MSVGLMVRLLFTDLKGALSAAQLVGGLEGVEVRAIYIGREKLEEMYEVLMELSGDSVSVDSFLRSASSINGFVEATVEDLDAEVIWKGIG